MILAKLDNDTATIIPYPKLMQTNNGTIMLFVNPGEGTIIHTSEGGLVPNSVGRYCTSVDMSNFRDFTGEITLRNTQ